MKTYMKESLGTKGGKAVLAVFFVMLIALSVAGALYVFKGDEWFGQGQAQTKYVSGEYSNSTFVFTLKEKNIKMKKGDTKTIDVQYDKDYASDIIQWESSDSKVVHIDPDGNMVALKKGKVTITATAGYYSAQCTVKVSGSDTKTKKSYSTAYTANEVTLEKNKKDKSDKNLYSIKVNRLKNCVTVYTYDDKGKYTVPVRAMICSCGDGDDTPTGEFTVSTKMRWHALYGNVYGQYVTQFNGDILFHSVPYATYEDPSSVEVEDYNSLGESISMGCVRLAVADAKWIYKNCDEGTTVIVYENEKDGPLGTPPSMKINTKKSEYWDPTDDDKSNPYYSKKPKLKGVVNGSIDVDDYFDSMNGIKATDTSGSDITDSVKVTGKVNTEKAGEYLLKYTVTDNMGRSTSQYRYITVK